MCTASLPTPQHPTTSHGPLKYPPPQCRRGRCIESRAKGRWQKGPWCLSSAACMFLWFLDRTNWCKQLQHAAVAHHPNRALHTKEAKFTCHAGHYISWKGMAMPVLSCMTWQICRQPEQNNWLCPLKDQHYPSLLCSQGAVYSVALALGRLRNSILLTGTELTF